MSGPRLTQPCSARACDAALKLPKGTTAAALRLGAPKAGIARVVPALLQAWLKDAPVTRLEPIAIGEGHAVVGSGWALVPFPDVRPLFKPGRKRKALDCEDCLSAWAPSPRWRALGPHVRVRLEQRPTIVDGQRVVRELLDVRCGACLSRLARIALKPFVGLLAVHSAVPRIEPKSRSRAAQREAQEAATMARTPIGAAS